MILPYGVFQSNLNGQWGETEQCQMLKGYIQIFDDCLCLCHLFISLGHKRLKEIIKSLGFCTVYFNSSKA